MQGDLRIPPTKVFFLSYQHSVVPPFCKYYVVFQDQFENYTDEDDIDMID